MTEQRKPRPVRDAWAFLLHRRLLLLVAGPVGGLLGCAVASSETGGRWWLWVAFAVAWLVASTVAAAAIRSALNSRGR